MWHSHKLFIMCLHSSCSHKESIATTDPGSCPQKRSADVGIQPGQSPAKKQRVPEASYIVDIDQLPGAKIALVKMSNQKSAASIQVLSGNKFATISTGPEECEIKEGSTVFGFGKVTWKRTNSADETPEEAPVSFPVKFSSCEDCIIMNSKLMTLREAIVEKRKTTASASICYHKLIDEVEAPVSS